MPEFPATLGNKEIVKHKAKHNNIEYRNYSILYDPSRYASLWVAYPLNSFYTSGSSDAKNWSDDPEIDDQKETNTWSGSYGVSFTGQYHENNLYARGHQIPAGSRTVSELRAQTYYSTNMTPQIQNGFNGGIWSDLENAIRGAMGTDTLYIVTGPVYQKVGGNETVNTIVNKNDNKRLDVANYYYKVVLKVKWSGNTVVKAKTIGFWYEHKDYPNNTDFGDSQYVKSVDDIEKWTGFNFFANLPDDLEEAAESKTISWSDFKTAF